MEEEHLESLLGGTDLTSDSLDDDSSVEINSMVDEENELVRLSTYLQLESEDEDNDEQSFESPDPPPSLLSSSSSDIEELSDSQQVLISTTPAINVNPLATGFFSERSQEF